MTGTESYYTQYANNEIMFHVSTLLPYVQNDPQQVLARCPDWKDCSQPCLTHAGSEWSG